MVRNGQSLLWPVGQASHCPINDALNGKVREHGVSHGLAEVGYDIRIKQEVAFRPHEQTGRMHYRVGPLWKLGRFLIASAIEEFDMPSDLMGIVHDKSTWARMGLSVFNTVIEPGWKGFLTLELVYHGQGELHIPAGSGIAQVVFHEITDRVRYKGKYQNQADQPVDPQFRD